MYIKRSRLFPHFFKFSFYLDVMPVLHKAAHNKTSYTNKLKQNMNHVEGIKSLMTMRTILTKLVDPKNKIKTLKRAY